MLATVAALVTETLQVEAQGETQGIAQRACFG
jgi:hypothetical protein